ncbi:hypothetical protein B0T19DRAFT_482546 [Cercophora scortea]|uniref:Uncharacterized protein n=1 Tax=Cercophora scortea TaxID=314031 RepID=A0AAE0IVX3_9PEZI|nr:hypothetical protein B0T19DRAFT_482546 [Cercophora scortea]
MFKRSKGRKDGEAAAARSPDAEAGRPDRIGRFGQLVIERGQNWFGRRRRNSTLASSRYRAPTPHPTVRLQGAKAGENEDENDGDDDDDADANFTPGQSTDNTTPPTSKEERRGLWVPEQGQEEEEDDDDSYMGESPGGHYKFHPKYRDFVKKKGVMVVQPTVPLPEPSRAVFDRVEKWLDAQPDLSKSPWPDTTEDSDTSSRRLLASRPANYRSEADLQARQYEHADLRSKQEPSEHGSTSKDPTTCTKSALRHHADPFPLFPASVGTPLAEQSINSFPSRTSSPLASNQDRDRLTIRTGNTGRTHSYRDRTFPYQSQRWEPRSPAGSSSPPLIYPPHRGIHGASSSNSLIAARHMHDQHLAFYQKQEPTVTTNLLKAPSIPPLAALASLNMDTTSPSPSPPYSARCFSEPTTGSNLKAGTDTQNPANSYELSPTASALPHPTSNVNLKENINPTSADSSSIEKNSENAEPARPRVIVPSIAESLAREGLGPTSRSRHRIIADAGYDWGGASSDARLQEIRGLNGSAASSVRKMIEDMEARNMF